SQLTAPQSLVERVAADRVVDDISALAVGQSADAVADAFGPVIDQLVGAPRPRYLEFFGAARRGDDEMRKLDRPFHRDQHAIRPILSSHPGVDLFAAWKAPAVRYLRPITQHPPDQPTLFFHPLVPPYLANFAVAQAVR